MGHRGSWWRLRAAGCGLQSLNYSGWRRWGIQSCFQSEGGWEVDDASKANKKGPCVRQLQQGDEPTM